MLSKPSKATTLIDLQEELGQLKQYAITTDIEMRGDSNPKGFEKHEDLFGALNEELSKAFTGLLK